MRSMLWLLWVGLLTGQACVARADEAPARPLASPSEGIVQVLHRSQQTRLDSLPPVDRGTPDAVVVELSFRRLVRLLGLPSSLELRVIRGPTMAETVHGDVVVANELLAGLPEGERSFILAHELGHVALGHWAQLGELFQRYVPGEVTQARTDAVAGALGREASGLAHRHELDADAFALRSLRVLGQADQHAAAALTRFGFRHDTATHPGTRKRLAALCAIDGVAIETAALDGLR